MFELTFLEAGVPLVKSYSLDSEGKLVKESYPRVWEFTSHTTKITSLTEFYAALTYRASLGHCLLKGGVGRPLVAESRAGSTDPNISTRFLCLDLDRLPPGVTVEHVMQQLGLSAYSYIVQYSASYGIEKEKGATAHVFILLTSPVTPPSLKQWLIWQNLHVPLFAERLALTKTNNAISWPLDITTCQNDKLIYLAPPSLGAGVTADFTHERIQIIEKGLPALDPDRLVIPNAEQNRTEAVAALDALRARAGLPARKWTYRLEKGLGLEVLAKPDSATLTGIKADRGFVYFNLNGGDSWGYYHAADSPEVIRNFKGEPNYLTSELLPEYWEQVLRSKKKVRNASSKSSTDLQVLAFRDFRSATYYNGTYDPESGALQLARAASEKQLADFCVENGRPVPESIPVWNLFYDPCATGPRVDAATGTVNLFTPSKYMEGVQRRAGTGDERSDKGLRSSDTNVHRTGSRFVSAEAADAGLLRRCPAIHRLVHNSVGQDPGLTDHYVNWVGCILIHRKCTRTGWALHGIEGTGKGQLLNRVLIPLLGASNVVTKRMVEMKDQFNSYVERSLMVVVDEAELSGSKESDMIMATLKNQITEPFVSVRKMYTASYLVPNYCNYQFFSNKSNVVVISQTDRRFNVGEYCRIPLSPTDEFLDQVTSELDEFAAYLYDHGADLAQAARIYESASRDQMRATSTNSIDAVAEALTSGNLEFFWDNLPAGTSGMLGIEAQATCDAYVSLIHNALRAEHGVQRLTRDEVRVLFAYNVGELAKTPAKFTALLRHHRVVLEPIRVDGRVVRGMEVSWQASADWLRDRLAELNERMPSLRLVKEKERAS